MQSLSGRTGEIEGLRDVIASFADGSQESVNAIAGMSSASDEDLRTMVENWQALQQEQDAASHSIADLKENYTAQMDAWGQELAADIQAMDLGPEAAAAAKATIQEYINSATSMIGQVQAAYAGIAAAAQAALGSVRPGAGSGVAGTGGTTAGAGPGGVSNNIPGHATGTTSTEDAFIAGENGPELITGQPKKVVYTAEETRDIFAAQNAIQAMQAESRIEPLRAIPSPANVGGGGGNSGNDGSGAITIENNPTIIINGDKPEGLEEALRKNNQNLLQMVMEYVKSREDERRTRFA